MAFSRGKKGVSGTKRPHKMPSGTALSTYAALSEPKRGSKEAHRGRGPPPKGGFSTELGVSSLGIGPFFIGNPIYGFFSRAVYIRKRGVFRSAPWNGAFEGGSRRGGVF